MNSRNLKFCLPEPYGSDEAFCAEWAKMLSGDVYEAQHHYFHELLVRTRVLVRRFNDASPDDAAALENLLREIFPITGTVPYINQPLRVDYGCNVRFGNNVFINFNFTVLDESIVTIGDNAFVGPNVSIYTACHPLDADERRDGREWAEPVTIGRDVWIGGGATILPGVTVGDGAVIGAGAVVTHDVPPRTVVGGNPARFIKKI